MEKFEEKKSEDEIELENADELENMEYEGIANSYVFKEVRVTKKDFSIYELLRKYKQGKLILDVSFQRKRVWNEKQKCELIESILMGLPLPIFYFKQLDNSKYVVVDGKQRLSALFEYLNNEFSMKNLKILDFLNTKRFKDLEDELGIYQSQLEDYQVYAHVILPPTPDKILFDIFDRVNRGGTKLNKQEIRNALYQGKGMEMIHEITEGESFQKAARIEAKKDFRMKGAYLLTRFFAFYLYLNRKLSVGGKDYQYNGDVDYLIEISLKYLNSCTDMDLMKLKKQTESALENSYFYLGKLAFRKTATHPINMNLFETTLFLMTNITTQKEGIKDVLKDKLYNTINSKDFSGYIGNGRDSVSNVEGRFRMMNLVIKEIKT